MWVFGLVEFALANCNEMEDSHDGKDCGSGEIWSYRTSSERITGIELKSLILAQIERWRHALHMQVERQHGSLLLVASGERVSNTSERTLKWGIT